MKEIRLGLLCFIAAAALLAGCGGRGSGTQSEYSLAVSAFGDLSPLGSPVVTPTTPAIATPEIVELVILHTNDNWGETEPCG